MATARPPGTGDRFALSVFKNSDVESDKPWVAFARNLKNPLASVWMCYETEPEAQEGARQLQTKLNDAGAPASKEE